MPLYANLAMIEKQILFSRIRQELVRAQNNYMFAQDNHIKNHSVSYYLRRDILRSVVFVGSFVR